MNEDRCFHGIYAMYYCFLQGVVRLAHDSNPQGAGGGINVSIFDTLNEKLLAQGFPRWNAGPYVVEPIVSVGFILATVLMGFHGLIFAVLLFGLVKYSNSNGGLAGLMGGPSNQGPTGRARGRGGRPNSGTGSGQRLGRL